MTPAQVEAIPSRERRNILIAGYPGVGKTTLVERLIKRCGRLTLTGFLTREVRASGRRVGFRAVALQGSSALFAHRDFQVNPGRRVGPYGVRPELLEELVLPHLDPERKDADLVVDEMGRMELLSAALKARLEQLPASPVPLLGTVALRRTGWIKRVKMRADLELFTLTRGNRDVLVEEILRRLGRLCPALG